MENAVHSPRVSELLRFTTAHRRHTEALAQATGEHFNIFKILRIGHLEVKTHSPILGELLNPKGQHGQGAKFLRLFLPKFKIEFAAESETATMELEYWTGPVTEKSGGRIDIVVKDGKGSKIYVENKIYARDGEKQMMRYHSPTSFPRTTDRMTTVPHRHVGNTHTEIGGRKPLKRSALISLPRT